MATKIGTVGSLDQSKKVQDTWFIPKGTFKIALDGIKEVQLKRDTPTKLPPDFAKGLVESGSGRIVTEEQAQKAMNDLQAKRRGQTAAATAPAGNPGTKGPETPETKPDGPQEPGKDAPQGKSILQKAKDALGLGAKDGAPADGVTPEWLPEQADVDKRVAEILAVPENKHAKLIETGVTLGFEAKELQKLSKALIAGEIAKAQLQDEHEAQAAQGS